MAVGDIYLVQQRQQVGKHLQAPVLAFRRHAVDIVAVGGIAEILGTESVQVTRITVAERLGKPAERVDRGEEIHVEMADYSVIRSIRRNFDKVRFPRAEDKYIPAFGPVFATFDVKYTLSALEAEYFVFVVHMHFVFGWIRAFVIGMIRTEILVYQFVNDRHGNTSRL